MKTPWRRMLDVLVQTCLGRQDWNAKLGVPGDVIGLDVNNQWGPVSAGGNPVIGLDVIFRPGGVAGGNVFTTWTDAYNAASGPAIEGPVTLAVDDSLAAANVDPGGWDLDTARFQIKLTTANPAGGATLNVPANAELINPTEIQGTLTLTLNSPVGGLLPGLSFSGAARVLTVRNGGGIDSTGGAAPGAGVAPGTFLLLVAEGAAFNGALGAEVVNIGAGATVFGQISNTGSTAPENFMAGAGTLNWNQDAFSFFPIADANFTGTLSNRTTYGPNRWAALDIGAGTLIVDASYIAGSGTAECQIFASPVAPGTTIISLPQSALPSNIGRHLRVVAVLSSAVNAITLELQNPAADHLQGVLGGTKSLQGPIGTAWLIETDGVNGWFVQICAAI